MGMNLRPKSARQKMYLMQTHARVAGVPDDSGLLLIDQVYVEQMCIFVMDQTTK